MADKWIQSSGVSKHKGALHRALHVPEDKPIPASKLSGAMRSSNPHMKHMAQFAKTAKGFKPKRLFSTTSRKTNPQDHDSDDGY